jgi:hypothetical protein
VPLAQGQENPQQKDEAMKKPSVPYENATSGDAARGETTKLLRNFGCESIGFMDDFAKHEVLLAFKHRGRTVQLRANAQGWAALWLKAHPYNWGRHRGTEIEYKQRALRQGDIAINSILRDWVKGQVTAVECGMMPFEAVFMPYMLTSDGRSVLERIQAENLLPAPTP